MSIFYIFLYISEGKFTIFSCYGTGKQNIFCWLKGTICLLGLPDVTSHCIERMTSHVAYRQPDNVGGEGAEMMCDMCYYYLFLLET